MQKNAQCNDYLTECTRKLVGGTVSVVSTVYHSNSCYKYPITMAGCLRATVHDSHTYIQ